ncbi:MAG TPA: zf-HC2 domain-containing protein [Solirubrobacterales bacterium]|nr:zf-HC2 domain-containing protein [Solirubrobacterales bacterium]
MSARTSCEELRAMAPELALGIAGGDERARALEHLAACPACRRHLEELSGLADEFLLLAPTQEPPGGFETRVLEELQRPPEPRRRPRRRAVIPALAAAAAAAVTAVGMWLAFSDDRDLASQYRDIFAQADGRYFDVQPLSAPGGAEAGTVFGYQGRPSWVLITVEAPEDLSSGRYDVQVIGTEGRRMRLRPLWVRNHVGSGGESLPIDLEEVAEVRLIGPGRGNVLQAKFGPWAEDGG